MLYRGSLVAGLLLGIMLLLPAAAHADPVECTFVFTFGLSEGDLPEGTITFDEREIRDQEEDLTLLGLSLTVGGVSWTADDLDGEADAVYDREGNLVAFELELENRNEDEFEFGGDGRYEYEFDEKGEGAGKYAIAKKGINPVPEPATMTLLLAGLGAAGLSLGRRG